MTNHPNRGPGNPASNPKPDEIRAAREAAGLTQDEAAALIYCSGKSWQQWELGARRMHPAFWHLFSIRVSGRLVARSLLAK